MRAVLTQVLAAGLGLAACAGTVEVQPERVEAPRWAAPDGTYALDLPLGWLRAEHALTLDGWDAQTITFNAGPVLATDDGAAIDAAAPELLVAMQDQLAQQPGVDLVELRAATLDGLAGFRLHQRRPAEGGVPAAEIVVYGAIDGAMLYAFSLESRRAASFARDLDAFERMVASFRRAEPDSRAR